MKQYLDLVKRIFDEGEFRPDRTGMNTISRFGTQTRYDLREGFPLLTTKKVSHDAVFHELMWFLRGSTNINDNLTQHTPIWDAWANENGELGPIYGHQWRKWPSYDGIGIDQIKNAVDLIKSNPDSRRIIVSSWNVAQIDQMALPPCHAFFQFYVNNGNLDCQLYQRSADVALGVPYNIASYATLMHIIGKETGMTPREFVHTLGDAHIYCGADKEFYDQHLPTLKDKVRNAETAEDYKEIRKWIKSEADGKFLGHVPGLLRQLGREPRELPTLEVKMEQGMDNLTIDDFAVSHYQPKKFIPFKVAV